MGKSILSLSTFPQGEAKPTITTNHPHPPHVPFTLAQVARKKSHNKVLLLGDGALNPSGNIPIYPALLPERGVDVLIAVDASSDTSDNLPNGAGLISSGRRSWWDGWWCPRGQCSAPYSLYP